MPRTSMDSKKPRPFRTGDVIEYVYYGKTFRAQTLPELVQQMKDFELTEECQKIRGESRIVKEVREPIDLLENGV
jgi:hypothetical protein